MKRVTIKDIAEYLTLSVSTVSRALTDDKNIRKETKELVVDAARHLGYMPNPVALNLRTGRTNTVGVIVPEMVTPFASEVIGGIQEVLYGEGMKVIFANSAESWKQERENLSIMERFMVDGIIVSMCDYKKNKTEYQRLLSDEMPMVFYDRIAHGMNVSQVMVDDYLKSFFMVEHLIRSGRKKIVHIKGSDAVYNTQDRVRGWQDALSKFHLNNSSDLIIGGGGLSFSDGASAVDSLIERGVDFDGIFAFTDTLGIGALNRLRELGINVPQAVGVASFSGTALSNIVTPQLSTVESPLREMGIESARLLLERIKNPESPVRSVVLDATLRLRGSSVTGGI